MQYEIFMIPAKGDAASTEVPERAPSEPAGGEHQSIGVANKIMANSAT